MGEGIENDKMTEVRKIVGLDEGVRAEMDTDEDGKLSYEEFKVYMSKKRTQKEKLKGVGVYLGDKAVDLIVVSVAVVCMYFFGISII